MNPSVHQFTHIINNIRMDFNNELTQCGELTAGSFHVSHICQSQIPDKFININEIFPADIISARYNKENLTTWGQKSDFAPHLCCANLRKSIWLQI